MLVAKPTAPGLQRLDAALDARGGKVGSSGILAIALLAVSSSIVQSREPESPQMLVVERFIGALNAHDSKAMAALATDDIQWLSILDGKVTVETNDKSQLLASMTAYFKSCPTCQSYLSGAISTRDRVSAIEVASWQGKTGHRSQRGLSVYEFSGDLIRRVYYFPAEK